jgi:hypothetical protein
MEGILDSVVGMCFWVVLLTRKEVVTEFIKGFGASTDRAGTSQNRWEVRVCDRI